MFCVPRALMNTNGVIKQMDLAWINLIHPGWISKSEIQQIKRFIFHIFLTGCASVFGCASNKIKTLKKLGRGKKNVQTFLCTFSFPWSCFVMLCRILFSFIRIYHNIRYYTQWDISKSILKNPKKHIKKIVSAHKMW